MNVRGVLVSPTAQTLLESRIPARLAYCAVDGTPRVQPIWFHWNGESLVLATGGDVTEGSRAAAQSRGCTNDRQRGATVPHVMDLGEMFPGLFDGLGSST